MPRRGGHEKTSGRTLICGCVQTSGFRYATSRSEPFPSGGRISRLAGRKKAADPRPPSAYFARLFRNMNEPIKSRSISRMPFGTSQINIDSGILLCRRSSLALFLMRQSACFSAASAGTGAHLAPNPLFARRGKSPGDALTSPILHARTVFLWLVCCAVPASPACAHNETDREHRRNGGGERLPIDAESEEETGRRTGRNKVHGRIA